MHDHKTLYKIGEQGTIVGISVNFLLLLFKAFAGIAGRSQAMLADALHTASDLMTSFAVLIGFKIAKTPPDPHHPYGHGKAESIASKIVSLTLIALGLKIVFNSFQAIFFKPLIPPRQIALWAAVGSIFVKEGLFRYTFWLGEKISSTALKSDAWHHRSDALSSIAALIGIGGARIGFPILDPLAGIVVSVFVIKAGVNIFHTAYDELMDAAPSGKLLAKIKNLAGEVRGVKGIKDIKVRKMGLELFVDMTIELDKDLSVKDSHFITAMIRRNILEHISGTKDVLIHVEPYIEK